MGSSWLQSPQEVPCLHSGWLHSLKNKSFPFTTHHLKLPPYTFLRGFWSNIFQIQKNVPTISVWRSKVDCRQWLQEGIMGKALPLVLGCQQCNQVSLYEDNAPRGIGRRLKKELTGFLANKRHVYHNLRILSSSNLNLSSSHINATYLSVFLTQIWTESRAQFHFGKAPVRAGMA